MTGPAGNDLLPDEPDELQVGRVENGAVRRIAEVVLHDRAVLVPGQDAETPQYLTQTAHAACLPDQPGQTP